MSDGRADTKTRPLERDLRRRSSLNSMLQLVACGPGGEPAGGPAAGQGARRTFTLALPVLHQGNGGGSALFLDGVEEKTPAVGAGGVAKHIDGWRHARLEQRFG